MSSGELLSSRCHPPCEVRCHRPWVQAWNEPCVTSCQDSHAVVYAPPVVVTFPGPILSSCPQESYVGTSVPTPIGWFSGGMGSGESGGFGDGGSYGGGSSLGMGGMYGGSSSLGMGGMYGGGSSFGS
ncbi:KRFA protein, partial [Anhinga anhinga]|nr:KRFA protein [Anhinga anhinga]NXC72892.1 KRFA protein [Anhinga anhinga]